MKKLKLMTFVGTRPEIIKLAETIKLADKCFDHILVHTGQNWDYNLNGVFFEQLGLREPNYFLNVVGEHLGQTIGNVIAKSYEVLSLENPDAILVLGDTNSCLATISAKRLKIPIFHMEAGNRCFDQNVPEEINRKIVDHLSDVNFAYSEHARRNLLNEGSHPGYTFVVGSPMKEILNNNINNISSSSVLNELNLTANEYFLVSCHREENVDNNETFKGLFEAINQLCELYNRPVVLSTHPRTWKRIEEENLDLHRLVLKMKPFGFFDYNKLQKEAFCVLSDSGTLAEESSILKFPAVSIRTSTERPEVMDKGSMILGGTNLETIMQAIEISTKVNVLENPIAPDYQDENVSQKIINIIQGYTTIINKNVWKK